MVCVEDRSRDECWEVLQELAELDAHLVVLRLSRNFGQHAAITAGLAECQGEVAVVMDCDLQDPPEVITQFWQAYQEGYEVVVGSRKSRSHSSGRRLLAWAYTRLMRVLGRPKYDASIGSFSLISRKVITEFLRFRDVNRHYLFILDWLGFERTVVPFEQNERFCGRSSYSLTALVRHAVQGIFFQTSNFLRWIVAGGAVAAAIGFMATIYIIVQYFLHGAQPGWTSLAVSIWTIGGLIMATLGIVGLYVGQVFDQVKGRPLYVVETRINHTDELAKRLPAESAEVIVENARGSADEPSLQPARPR